MPEQSADSQAAEATVERAMKHLLSLQAADGYWWGELEADTTLESDHILLHCILVIAGMRRYGSSRITFGKNRHPTVAGTYIRVVRRN